METATLRQKLHSLIETSSEEKLDEIYDLLKEDEYSDDFKAMLDNEFEQYQKDGEVISRTEIDKIVEQLLHPKNNKLSIQPALEREQQENI